MKLKFVILGGANAGKTSILRRYFHGTFDTDRMPTMGADFYSKKVEFEFVVNNDKASLSAPFSTGSEPSVLSHVDEGDQEQGGGGGNGGGDEVEYGNKDMEGDDGSSTSQDEKKDASSLHPTAAGPPQVPVSTSTRPVSIQIWDTPGRERYVNNDNSNNNKTRYIASFSDSFFKNVDAAILVYDVSSSTSFTHVLKWHAELMERIRRMEASGERSRPLPIVIVGNKIDIFQERDTQKELKKREVVKQRDVLGVAGKKFRGQDYRYEYSASAPYAASLSASASASSRMNSLAVPATSGATGNAASNTIVPPLKNGNDTSHRNRFEISTYMGTSNQTNYLEAILNNEVYRGSYLDSLLSSEDNSHPDKDMVIVSIVHPLCFEDTP